MYLLRTSYRTAKEWRRVGTALQELPALRGAFAPGRLSWEQVAPATVFATPATDGELAHDLAGHTGGLIPNRR